MPCWKVRPGRGRRSLQRLTTWRRTLWAAVLLRSPAEDLAVIRHLDARPARPMATISECWYRWLRAPATTDPGDTKSPGSQPPNGGRASFCPQQSTGPRLDRPGVRSDLCRKATTSHVRTSRPTDRFLHGRNGATVDDILGSGD